MVQEPVEAFGALGEAFEIAATAHQVGDELPPGGLFLPHRHVLGSFVAFGEGVDGLLDGGEEVVGGGLRQIRADPLRGGEASADEGPQPDVGLRGPLPCSVSRSSRVSLRRVAHTLARISAYPNTCSSAGSLSVPGPPGFPTLSDEFSP
ncbi:hypothetical protein [Streptomyces sp. NBC_00316]|uniref:hypothetical protein n=1 Tax=Streptomyces sp. NBC_00316 TaxID=2975710 RepID=UPI002E2C1367|nr:hypothetical protein [Streptomyces sp. NBC_00316]